MSIKPKKVLVTGATGFTGSYTIPALLKAGYEVSCFVRPTSDLQFLPNDQLSFIEGTLDDPDSLTAALSGHDAIINIASLGFGHADSIVNVIEAAGIQRAIFVSTTALFTKLNAPSKTVRLAAEKRIKESTLNYTILRPTMIYGSGRDRNICRLIQYLSRFPVLPVFGTGDYLLQPIYVADVAQAIVKALPEATAHRQAYNISGHAELTYNQLVDTVSEALGRKTWKLHIPHKPMIALLTFSEKLVTLPIKAEQIQRLNEHKNFSFDQAKQDFNFAPRSFSDGIHLELKDMELL
jgi:uncharacterized protein YbjT (DUF2867 family)